METSGINTPIHPKVDGARFALIVITLLFYSGTGILHAQPVDLCSLPNGYQLTSGGTDQVTAVIDAGKTIKVELLSDCDEEKDPEATNGVYCTGWAGNYTPTPNPLQWFTGTPIPDPLLPETKGTIYVSADDTFTISLDACEGTIVKLSRM